MDKLVCGSRSLVKRGLGAVGLELSWRRSAHSLAVELRRPDPRLKASRQPTLVDSPLVALHHERGGKSAVFDCPVEQCVHVNGLNFRGDGWHPCSALLEQYAQGDCDGYEGSVLQKYYDRWQPKNAQEALIGLQGCETELARLPSHLMYLFPWLARSVDEADAAVRAWCHGDNIEHGQPDLSIEQHGFKDHGPLHHSAGQLEFERLVRLYRSIRDNGFEGPGLAVRVLLLKRGGDYRYFNFGGGLHRTAAMKALGYSTVPARFQQLHVFDVADAAYWPQVRAGVWTEEAVARYFDHLFDFDAGAWARERIIGESGPARAAASHG